MRRGKGVRGQEEEGGRKEKKRIAGERLQTAAQEVTQSGFLVASNRNYFGLFKQKYHLYSNRLGSLSRNRLHIPLPNIKPNGIGLTYTLMPPFLVTASDTHHARH